MSYTVLIADDEKLSRDYIRNLLKEFLPEDTSVDEAASIDETSQALDHNRYDIVFMDIRMPGRTGLSLMSEIYDKNFELVFITAYNEYAIDAIKEGAFDYILKPINKFEFKETLLKLIKRLSEKKGNPLREDQGYLDNTLCLRHIRGFKVLTLKEIVRMEASNTYTTFITADGKKITVSRPISHFNALLNSRWFFRLHKSHMINMYHLHEFVSDDGGYALMKNGDKVYISRYRLQEFMRLIDRITGELNA